MPTFTLRLQASRDDFAMTMTDAEREVMMAHAEHWQPYVESGQMVVFGPVLEGGVSWGLGVLEADDEDAIRAHAASDPAVGGGVGTLEVGTLLTGFVRPG